MNLPIIVRQCFDQEHNFIYNSWIKSGHRSRATEIVAKELYTLNQHDIITHLLARCTVLVAQELDKPESIYGYIVYSHVDGVFTLHYAYTKQMFRRLGVFSALMRAANYNKNSAGFYTHSTKAMTNAVDLKFNLIYNPYLLINPKYAILNSSPKTKITPPPITELPEDLKEQE